MHFNFASIDLFLISAAIYMEHPNQVSYI